MGKIVVSENVTLDGVIQDPAGDEGFRVDELRLKIFPVALGADERLFGLTSDRKPLRLTGTQTLEGGITYLTYQPVRDA